MAVCCSLCQLFPNFSKKQCNNLRAEGAKADVWRPTIPLTSYQSLLCSWIVFSSVWYQQYSGAVLPPSVMVLLYCAYCLYCLYLYYLSGAIILNTSPLEVSQTYICPVIACICHLGIPSYLRDVIWCYPSLHPDTTLIPSYPPKPHLTITSYNSHCTSNTRLL